MYIGTGNMYRLDEEKHGDDQLMTFWSADENEVIKALCYYMLLDVREAITNSDKYNLLLKQFEKFSTSDMAKQLYETGRYRFELDGETGYTFKIQNAMPAEVMNLMGLVEAMDA